MKIGFIGCGNMATAIINGITNNNVVSEKDINAYDIFDGATKKLKENKDINICENEKDVVKSSDIIFLAVKPNVQASVLKAIDGEIKDKLIISIAAGKTIEFIEKNWTIVTEISWDKQKVYTDNFHEVLSLSFDEQNNCSGIFIGTSNQERFDKILDSLEIDWSYTSYEDEDCEEEYEDD